VNKDYPASDEALKRTEELRFSAAPFSILDAIKADPNVSPAFRCVIGRPTLAERIAYKQEQSREDFGAEQLWRARGGQE
jgi:hypothetical protein